MGIFESLVLPIFLSVAANKVSNYFAPNIQRKIKKAYESALKKWSKNEDIIWHRSNLLSSDFGKVINDLKLNPQDLNREDQQLLEYFKTELASDADLLTLLNSIQQEEVLKIIQLDHITLNSTHENTTIMIKELQKINETITPKKKNKSLPFNYFIKNKKQPYHYVLRRVKVYNDSPTDIEQTTTGNTIAEVIEQTDFLRMVLLGGAGLGKTTELQQVAWEISKRKRYPIFVSLNNYTSGRTNIGQYFNPRWNEVPPQQLVILMDGFDEIEPGSTMQAVRDIQAFAEQNPSVKIIVSSRTNFYNKASGEEEGSTLRDFSPYLLEPFTQEDYKRYITKNFTFEYDRFYKEVTQNKLLPLLENPFFLIALAEIYAVKGKLDKNRSLIIGQLIDKRLNNDIEHYKDTVKDIADNKDHILKTLKEIAACMVVAGLRRITGKELLFLARNQNNVNLIKRATLFIKSNQRGYWQFEHSYFQEYLAAQHLADLNIDEIKHLITGSGSGHVIPTWQNTLTLLLSLVKPTDSLFSDLIDWLVNTDPVALLDVEPERLSEDLREQIFRNVFNYYKDKLIWLDNTRINYEDYALFGNIPACIDFIVDEATNSANEYIVRMNALYVMQRMDFSNYVNARRVLEQLLSLVEDQDATPNFISNLIDTITEINLHFLQRDIKHLFDTLKHRDNEYIRTSLYRFLLQKKQAELYIDYFLEGILILKNKKLNSDRLRITFIGESQNITTALLHCKSGESICKIIEWLIQNRELLHEFHIKEWFSGMIDNAIAAYPTHKEISRYMFRLLSSTYISEHKILDKIISFFQVTTTTKELINSLLDNYINDHHYILIHILSRILSPDNYQIIIEAYIAKKLTDDDLISLCRNIHNNKQKLNLRKEIEERTGLKIILPRNLDWNKRNQEKIQAGFDILFDAERFRKECEDFVSKYSPLTQKKYNDIRTKRIMKGKGKDVANRSVTSLVEDILYHDDNIKLTSEQIRSYIHDWNLISEIYELLKNDSEKKIKITPQQLNYIKSWFMEYINKVDFTQAINKGEGNQISINTYSIFLFYFKKRFEFDCDEKVLLDMTLCSGTQIGELPTLDYLYALCNKESFEQRIIENVLDNKIPVDFIYEEHLKFIFEHKLTAAYSHILSRLTEKPGNGFLQSRIIRLYFQAELPLYDIKKIWIDLNINLKLKVAEELSQKEEFPFLKDNLPSLYIHADKDQQKAINKLLIKCRDISGLKNSINWIKLHKENPFNELSGTWFNYEDISALPFLMQILEYGYDKSISQSPFMHRMERLAVDGLKYLALAKIENFPIVTETIESFIIINKDKFEHVEFLNSYLESIKMEYDKKYYHSYSLEAIKAMLMKT